MNFKVIPLFLLLAVGWTILLWADVSEPEFLRKLVAAAKDRTQHQVIYDGSYRTLSYPGGDVPPNRGVCTDVVIRSYRALGIDLQVKVHEDMKGNFKKYPTIWGMRGPDRNIDHRRVPNLITFFKRKGKVLPISENAKDYAPGDIVTWDLGGGLTHIGLLVKNESSKQGPPLVVHNIGAGPKKEDVLFKWKITGHFRYFGK